MDEREVAGRKPAVPYLKFDEDDSPYLEGSRCAACGEIFLGAREACARCATFGQMVPMVLSRHGRLYNYTIVYRSYPGVQVPFVAAVVDLEGGGTVKGNLIGIDAAPEKITFDMPVEMVFRSAELANSAGAGFISHFFVPAGIQGGV